MVRRIIATLAILGLGSISIAVLAQEKLERIGTPEVDAIMSVPSPPMSVDIITFTAANTDKGARVKVTVGDVVFFVQGFSFPTGKSAIQNVTVEGGSLAMRTQDSTLEFKSLTMKLRNSQPVPEPPLSTPARESGKVPAPADRSAPPIDAPPLSDPPAPR